MASTIALRRATSLFSKLPNTVRYSASLAADLDSSPPHVFRSGSVDTCPPTRTPSQTFKLMDPLLNSFCSVAGVVGVSGFSSRQILDVRGEEKGLYLKMATPDQGKEDAKVSVGSGSSAIKGSGGKGSGEDEGKKFSVILARGIISTALFPISLFLHINEGMEEIIADYVHHEMTRSYVLVSMRLFLLIAAKDACVSLFF